MCVSALFATLAATATASAKTTYVVVLLDASGSMQELTNGKTRFQEAARVAEEELAQLTGTVVVDVYSFSSLGAGPGLTEHTNGFLPTVSVGTGLFDVLECVGGIHPAVPGFSCDALPANLIKPNQTFPATPFGATPLADSMCSSLTALLGAGAAGDSRILQVSSDGLENLSSGVCSGTFDGVYDGTKWTDGSWQANVITKFFNQGVHVNVSLFEFDFRGLPFAPPRDREAGFGAPAPAFSASLAADEISPLHQFFLSLTQATGGRVRVFNDNKPAPLFGDVNGGQCVDITDVVAVARAFGTPAAGSDFDLTVDGTIGFDDFQSVLRSVTPGCGVANPYTPRAPLVCTAGKKVTIDGQSVADGGLTIDARPGCQIVIKNSLVVAGQNAITVTGSAVITVDNSTIVGAQSVITQHGAVILSAAGSVFHGIFDTHGAFLYVDRGGNTFE
ncbi:MAG: hypothetical protein ABIY55_06395 [Kofleriaceae bacterium]